MNGRFRFIQQHYVSAGLLSDFPGNVLVYLLHVHEQPLARVAHRTDCWLDRPATLLDTLAVELVADLLNHA